MPSDEKGLDRYEDFAFYGGLVDCEFMSPAGGRVWESTSKMPVFLSVYHFASVTSSTSRWSIVLRATHEIGGAVAEGRGDPRFVLDWDDNGRDTGIILFFYFVSSRVRSCRLGFINI